jgi:hypothetical protein
MREFHFLLWHWRCFKYCHYFNNYFGIVKIIGIIKIILDNLILRLYNFPSHFILFIQNKLIYDLKRLKALNLVYLFS